MFVNAEAEFDQINEGTGYFIGPTPFVAYTLDDYRVEIASLAPAQVLVRRTAPGLFGSKYCIELMTTIQKGVTDANDNDNLERWIDPEDLRKTCWGTPYAKPLTVSFDVQGAVPGIYTLSMIDWSDHVYCTGTYEIPSANAVVERASVTFPAMTGGEWSQGAKFLTDLGSGSNFSTSVVGSWADGHAWHINGTTRLTTLPPGSYLRFGRFQADVGLVALPFRFENPAQKLLNCQRFLWKSMPQGVAVNNAVRGGVAAGIEGALAYFMGSPAYAGELSTLRLPTEMIMDPQVYTFSPGYAGSQRWYRANGNLESGIPQVLMAKKNALALVNPFNAADPNGSCFFLHVVACTQRGGNGYLGVI